MDKDKSKAQITDKSKAQITELWAQYGRLQAQREQGLALAEQSRQQMVQTFQQIQNLERGKNG